MNRLSDGSIAFSQNGGSTWSTNTQISVRGVPVVSARGKNVLAVNSHGLTQLLVSSFEEKSQYEGKLEEFETINAGWLPLAFVPHPFDHNAILALTRPTVCLSNATSEDCFFTSYFSRDFGRTWTRLATYSAGYLDWAPSAYNASLNSHEVILEDYAQKTGNGDPNHRPYGSKRLTFVSLDVQYSSNPFATVELQPLQENVLGAVAWKGVIFATKAVDPAHPSASALNLYTSHDNGRTFKLMRVPKSEGSNNSERFYSILDVTNGGAVFVNVRFEGWNYGNIYSSDENGDNYALTLRHGARDPYSGGADFGRTKGIEGIYFSNVELTPDVAGADLVTRISFDNGGEWFPLRAPASEIATCGVSAESCHLHLRKDMDSTRPNFFTTPNDIGLVMGVGNAGSKLKASGLNTYISHDAGKTWSRALDGHYSFDVSQNGGVLIANRNDAQTGTLKWSTDSGRSWKECVLPHPAMSIPPFNNGQASTSNELGVDEGDFDWTVGSHTRIGGAQTIELAAHLKNKKKKADTTASLPTGNVPRDGFRVWDLERIPSTDASARFILAARSSAGNGFIYLDFNATESRTCQGWDDLKSPTSDYEAFIPSDVDGDGCILGRKIVYARKKPSANCWVAHTVEPIIQFEITCQCSRQDYMCDYCFAPNATNPAICELDCPDYNPNLPPPNCHGEWYRTSGYRLVASNKCKGGVNKLGSMQQCPSAPTHTQPIVPPVYTPPIHPPTTVAPQHAPTSSPHSVPSSPHAPSYPHTPISHPFNNPPVHSPHDSSAPTPVHQKSKIVLPAIISSMTIVLMLGVLATLFFLSARNARVRHSLLRCVPDSWLPAYIPPDREGGARYHPLQGTGLSAQAANDDIFNDDEFLQEDANVLEMDEDD